MPLVSEQLPNLMNGVSQQALTMRLFSQAERQVNGYSSIVDGVNKRPPLKFLTKIIDGTAGDVYIHTINRDVSERYITLFLNGQIRVFDLQGNEKTVTYPDGTSYITTATPSSDIRAVTLADYTFVVNTTVTVEEDTPTAPLQGGEGQVFIRAVNYDTTYEVKVDGVVRANYTTADAYGTEPKVSIEEVVDDLANDLATNLGAGWTVTGYSPVVHITKDDGTDFTLEITDTNGNTMTRAIYGSVQRFTDLPVVGKHGHVVRVTGVDGEGVDDYWLEFQANKGSGFDSGLWKETVAPGAKTSIKASTMPHSLVRMPDGSFELRQTTWGQREVGDEESAPWPSFVGETIRDIFYDRNRLCVLSDDNVVMSRSRNLFSFFRETKQTLLDTDPIDVVAAGSKVSILQYAIPFNKQIVIFSDQTQFVLDAEKLLASEPPGIKEITAFEIDRRAKPIAVGKTVYFAVKSGNYTRMLEYYLVPETETTDAADVSKHVPKYVPSDVFKLAASPKDDVVFALNRTQRNRVDVYKYHWSGSQKLQSSWSHWELRSDAKVLNVEFIGDDAYFVIQYDDAVYIETMNVSEGVIDLEAPFDIRLDRQVIETDTTMVYDAGNNQTTVTLPYQATADGVRVVTRNGAITPAYKQLQVISVSGNDVVVFGDLTGEKFYVGESYVFEYEFTKPVLKAAGPSGGQASVLAGRLQLNRWLVAYANTGYFRAVVKDANGGTYTYTFTGKILGTSSATIGESALSDGEFGFRVNSDARKATVTLINDSFLPCYITAAEWEGRFERKTSRA